jgi:6-phosphogluconolactonase
MIRSAPRSSWQQTISALPADFTGTNTAAEIRVHPSGRFLYTTNRGHNSVAMFEIEPETGELEVSRPGHGSGDQPADRGEGAIKTQGSSPCTGTHPKNIQFR